MEIFCVYVRVGWEIQTEGEDALVEYVKPIEGIAEASGVRGIQADADVGAVDLVDEIAEFQGSY